jgi:3-phosphoglycerate kinase
MKHFEELWNVYNLMVYNGKAGKIEKANFYAGGIGMYNFIIKQMKLDTDESVAKVAEVANEMRNFAVEQYSHFTTDSVTVN